MNGLTRNAKCLRGGRKREASLRKNVFPEDLTPDARAAMLGF